MMRQALGRLKTTTKKIIRSELDALDLLRSDHMKIEAMLMQLRLSQNFEHRTRLLKRVRSELLKHMRLEEELFYPACADQPALKSLVNDALNDHREIRALLTDLMDTSASQKRFHAKMIHFIRALERHIVQEEDRILPMVRDELSSREFARVNREMIRKHHEDEVPARKPRKAA